MSKLNAIAALLLPLAGCMQGPGFLKQNAASDAALHPAAVSTTIQQNGGVSGLVSASSKQPQTITAASNSAIAGTKVTFPPGALAVDTQISLSPGSTIVTNSVAQQLNINSTVQSAGQPIVVSSSVLVDAATPFTLAIPLPSSGSLALTGDPYANLSVFYHINKQESGGNDFTGVITRDNLTVSKGVVSFAVRYFGTYQAAITATPITVASEVAAIPVTLEPSQQPHVYFARGPLTTTFGNDQPQSAENFQGWFHAFSPYRVTAPSGTLSTSISTKVLPTTTTN